jgi:hypothetical protein
LYIEAEFFQVMKTPPNHALQQTAARARALAVPSSLRSSAAAEGKRSALTATECITEPLSSRR